MIRRLLPSPSFHPSFPSSQRFAAEFPCHQDPFLKPTWCDGMESSSEIGGGHENKKSVSHSRSRSSRQSAVASVASLVFLAATLSLSGGTSSGLDLRPSFEWCWTVVFCRLQVGHGSSEKGEAVLSFLLLIIIRITSKHVQRDKARGGRSGWIGGVAIGVGRPCRTKSRAAADGERPRKTRRRRVRDLLPPDRITHE